MLIPLGFLGTGVQAGFELISTQVLASTATSVTFSSLNTYSSTYKHLQLRVTARSGAAAFQDNLKLVLNGDTTAAYAWHVLYGTGTTVSSTGTGSVANGNGPVMPGNSATANIFGLAVIDLMDFANASKTKTIKHLGGNAGGTGVTEVDMSSTLWNSTATLTSIAFQLTSGSSYAIGSRFSLYGVRG